VVNPKSRAREDVFVAKICINHSNPLAGSNRQGLVGHMVADISLASIDVRIFELAKQ
jgi:hypothetical protein